MKNKGASLKDKAVNYAFLLLKFRPRSKKELSDRLRRKKFPEDTITATISLLQTKGFVDDDAFARAWITSRLKRPFGLKRIENELKIKGIDKDIISAQISRIKKVYDEDSTAKELVLEKVKKLKTLDPRKLRQRLYGYMMRKGFSPDSVIDAINSIKDES